MRSGPSRSPSTASIVGLQLGGAALVAGTNRPVTFGGKHASPSRPAESVWSDAVALPFVADPAPTAARRPQARGQLPRRRRKRPDDLARQGAHHILHHRARRRREGRPEDEAAFPFSTTSWYFLDAVDMMAPPDSFAIVAFGDSITDGTASTLNGDDRWPDVLSRRLHARPWQQLAVVNAGIGGNQIVGPAEYAAEAVPGGPSAQQRLERDVLEPLRRRRRDLARRHQRFQQERQCLGSKQVQDGMKDVVGRIRAQLPELRVIGATVVTALGSIERRARLPGAGREAQGAQRVHPHVGPVRRRDRLRQGDARSADRRPEGRNSCPKARPAVPATSCIRTAPAIWRWAWRSTSIYSSRAARAAARGDHSNL